MFTWKYCFLNVTHDALSPWPVSSVSHPSESQVVSVGQEMTNSWYDAKQSHWGNRMGGGSIKPDLSRNSLRFALGNADLKRR